MPTTEAMLPARTQIAALVAFVGMIIFAFGYTFGPFHLSDAEVAQRVTQACSTLPATVIHTKADETTERELAALGTATRTAATQISALIPDAKRTARGPLRQIAGALGEATPALETSRVADGAVYVQSAAHHAGEVGAVCPAAITLEQGQSIDDLLQARAARRRAAARKNGTAPQVQGAGQVTESFVSP